MERRMPNSILAPVASALAVLAGLVLVMASFSFGPLSAHMALHIALMNVAAPLLAALLAPGGDVRPGRLWLLAALQIIALWAVHAPPVQRYLMASASLNVLAQVGLFLAAFCFWRALLRLAPNRRWHAIPVLALSGKLFCLLGVLLTFAPRLLFAMPSHADASHDLPAGLADQQLAGLLMITACPLSYLIAGVIMAAQIIRPAGALHPKPRDVR